MCCVVDGAAFGADLAWIVNGKPNSSGVCILAPESFEWLILSTSLYRHAFKAELERTYDFCDTKEYLLGRGITQRCWQGRVGTRKGYCLWS